MCGKVVEHWNELALHFVSTRPAITSELIVVTPLEKQLFDDAMIRPRFAILRLVLDLSVYTMIVFGLVKKTEWEGAF